MAGAVTTGIGGNPALGTKIKNLLKIPMSSRRGIKPTNLSPLQKLFRGGASFAGFSALGEVIQSLRGGGKDKDQINKDKPTKDGALAFLGGKKTGDPEPDIQYSPVEVLDNISQSLLPNETIIPEIDTTPVMATGMDGIIAELAKINFNLAAIRDAMVQSALIESQYRQELINDLEDALARKGKERSLERTKKKKKNILRSQIEPVTRKIGTTAAAIAKATALGAVMEIIALLSNTDSSGEPQWQQNVGAIADSTVGWWAGYKIGLVTGSPFLAIPPPYGPAMQQIVGMIGGVAGLMGANKLGIFETFVPQIIPNKKTDDNQTVSKENNNLKGVSDTTNSNVMGNQSNVGTTVPFDISGIRTTFPVGSSDNSTTIIDLRTAKNLVGGDTQTVVGVNDATKIVAELPRITHSGYEALAKGDSIT